MKISADKIERLVFIKYLLIQADASKELDRPLSSTTVLTLHDAVECFLQLSFEQLTGKAKMSGNQIIDTYSDKINEHLLENQKPLINKAFIKRINELRNQLKHSSIFIDKKNIHNLFSETDIFINDFTPIIFELDFQELSLTYLISNEEIKSLIVDAEEKIKTSQFQMAMFSIGKAFYNIEYSSTVVRGNHGENILAKKQRVNYLFKSTRFGGQEPDRTMKANLREIADDINRIHDELHDLKRIISLSADLKKYTKFKATIPYVSKVVSEGGERYWIPDQENNREVIYTQEQAKFCYDFVIELALQHND